MTLLAAHLSQRHSRGATQLNEIVLLLFYVLIEDLRDFARAFLRVALLAALVVYVGYTESRSVALGPFEVTAGTPSAYHTPRNT